MSALTHFRSKYQIDRLSIHRNASWEWSLRPHQSTYAASLLSSTTDHSRLSDINDREAIDFIVMVRLMERLFSDILACVKVNYFSLMLVDPTLHFHVIPRFEGKSSVHGQAVHDEMWPGPPKLAGDDAPSGTLDEICQFLRQAVQAPDGRA